MLSVLFFPIFRTYLALIRKINYKFLNMMTMRILIQCILYIVKGRIIAIASAAMTATAADVVRERRRQLVRLMFEFTFIFVN